MRLSSMESGQILIRRRGVARIRRGHLWVCRSDILNPKDAALPNKSGTEPQKAQTGNTKSTKKESLCLLCTFPDLLGKTLQRHNGGRGHDTINTIILAGVRPRLLCQRVGADLDLHKLLAYRCQPERD